MNQYPKVFVLILNYNGKYLLTEAINSYLANDYPNFRVVVIDNGSSDGSINFLSSEYNNNEIDVIQLDDNLGYSAGFNKGLEYAFVAHDADYVLITNNDVKADHKVISSLVEVAKNNVDAGFVTGKVYYYDHPDILQTAGKTGDRKYWRGGHIGAGLKDTGQFDTLKKIDWCDDIFWLVNRKLYLITGGYDTNFRFQGEDFDWQVRAKMNGFKIYYTPQAKIWHKDSMTLGKDSPMKSYYNYRNPLIVHMKYRKWGEYKYYFFKKLKALLISSVKNLFRLRIYYVYKSWCGLFSAIYWKTKNKQSISTKNIIP